MNPFTLEWWMRQYLEALLRSEHHKSKHTRLLNLHDQRIYEQHYKEIIRRINRYSRLAERINQRIIKKYGEDQ